IPVTHFPLNRNGKLDPKALPGPDSQDVANANPFPALDHPPDSNSELSTRLAEILAQLLGRASLGPDENLFDLGAHSLLMIEARERIQAETGHTLELIDLFHFPTIRQLAAHLEPQPAQVVAPAKAVPAPGLASDEIAIIGMALRLPGAASPEQFWQNLYAGVESIRRWQPEELLAAGHAAEDIAHPDYVPASGWCEGIENFDAAFFGISPREAELLDPQQRILLELAWEALDAAGYGDHAKPQPVGVFAGGGLSRYLLFHLLGQPLPPGLNPMQILIANDKDYLATRVAHKLNLTGPALSVQSACSSSLAAVHLACESLRAGACQMALAGGVSLDTRPSGYRWLEGAIYSRDGHCRPFDAEASGIVGGSGAAWVVLKPLATAQADGDPIYAVIKASALNNDGADKAGFLAPSVSGQQAVIQAALARAGISPEQIGVVEAHGTGTAIGDPIEVRALSLAWRQWTTKTEYCALGSLKGNLGHLDAAAGVASLIKAALMLKQQTIVPSINVQSPHPDLQLAQSPFYLPSQPQPWTGPDRAAAVSSLGIGGTNVHVILGAAPDVSTVNSAAGPEVVTLPLSAPSAAGLNRLSQELAQELDHHPLADIAWTLQRGRQALSWRGAITASTPAEAKAALASLVPHSAAPLPPLLYLCPGLGSQQAQMGLPWWDMPAYRQAIEACQKILTPDWPHDLHSLLLKPHSEAVLSQPAVMQPLIFAHGYALSQAWAALGLMPRALLGHSFGEYLAVTLAGMASLEQMLPLVRRRGELFGQLSPNDGVISVAARLEQIQDRLNPEISLVAINAPDRLSLSGPRTRLTELINEFAKQDLTARWLDIPHAVHHPRLDQILDPLMAAAAKVDWLPPRLRVIRGHDGSWYDRAPQARDWASQAREPIQFARGLERLHASGPWLGLELGPGRALASLAKRKQIEAFGGAADQRARSLWLGRLWSLGAQLNWDAMEQLGRRVPMPTTPLSPRRHWIEPGSQVAMASTGRLPFGRWFQAPLWRRGLLPAGPDPVWQLIRDLVEPEARQKELAAELVLPCPALANWDEALNYWDRLRVWLLQLAATGWQGRVHLLTPPVSRVSGGEALDTPWPALLLGLVRCLGLELPGLRARLIESDGQTEIDAREWAQAEPHVAWRHGMRWLPQVESVGVSEPVQGPFKLRGVYVITGASGGLGQGFASWLRRHCQARLVLLSRRQLPDQAETLPLAVDMANPQQVQAALASARAYFGEIDGIIHAAGEPGHHLLAQLDQTALALTLRAKVLGSLHLQQAIDQLGLKPDFVLLCSSLASQIGSPGQSAYAAANAWLDAFAQTQGAPWLSVDWGSWQGAGMAERALTQLPSALQPLYRQFLELGLDPEGGCRALEQVLIQSKTTGLRQILVSPVSLSQLERMQSQALARVLGSDAPSTAAPAPTEMAKGELENLISVAWEQLLGVLPGRAMRFSELGGDSLMAVQMKALLEMELGQELPLGPFLQDYPLSALAAALRGETGPNEHLLVPLNGVKTGPPLFMVHAISGTVFPFRHLAEVLTRPAYGLQSRGLAGNVPHRELAAMARAYRQVIEAQAEPPYTIGGWSFGGLVAFEMARQWQAEGRPAAQLILLDMQAPDPDQALDEVGLRQRFEADLAGLDGQGAQAGKMKDRLWRVFAAHVQATRDFEPTVLNLPTLLLVAEKGFGATHPEPDLGWSPWLPQLKVQRIPGDHYSCLDPANLAAWSHLCDHLP
ncbi:MAG: hypothetical protein CVV27_03205, partial [Candidatus Melainabacteria bacterium HGW-Melainabacteria-1]